MLEVEDHVESGQSSPLEVVLLGQVQSNETVLALPVGRSTSSTLFRDPLIMRRNLPSIGIDFDVELRQIFPLLERLVAGELSALEGACRFQESNERRRGRVWWSMGHCDGVGWPLDYMPLAGRSRLSKPEHWAQLRHGGQVSVMTRDSFTSRSTFCALASPVLTRSAETIPIPRRSPEPPNVKFAIG